MNYYFAQYFIDDEFSSDVFLIEGTLNVALKIENQLKKRILDKDILLISKKKVGKKEYEEYNSIYSYV